MVILYHGEKDGKCARRIARSVPMAPGNVIPVSSVDVHQVAAVVKNRIENVLIIDSRSFIEHNASHVASSVNVCCSKIVKRRLQQDKLSVKELLMHTCHCDVEDSYDIVVYDQASKDLENLPADCFVSILIKKLQLCFRSVNLLSGGFLEFQAFYPDLCEDKTRKCPPLSSLSQPCLPIANQGPTRILPFLYLGTQFDALNQDLLKDHNITYELNVSATCPQPDFVLEGHFMRIPVNDNYSEKLLPHFPKAFNFLDKVREGNSCVLVHCLAGISRSPTVAIAYVMRHLRLTSDDGYRYVKSKRPTISPNFNFLGQLLEYEKQLRQERILDGKPEASSAPPFSNQKRICRTDMRTAKLSLDISTNALSEKNTNIFLQPRSGDQSPTTALAKLSFAGPPTPDGPNSCKDEEIAASWPDFKQYRSKSCYGDWLRDQEDSMVEHRAVKECHVAAAHKTLSPVKEVKCEALISEISSGNKDNPGKSVVRNIRHQRTASCQPFSEEKSCVFSGFQDLENKVLSSSCWNTDVSVQTLSCVNCSPSHRASVTDSDFCASKQFKNQDGQCIDSAWSLYRTSKSYSRVLVKENSPKIKSSQVNTLVTPEKEFTKKSEFPIVPLNQLCSSDSKTAPFLNPFSFANTYRRLDSAGTSGFGSESSDCADNCGEEQHDVNPCERSRLELDVEDLEDEVILRNPTKDQAYVDKKSKDSAYFSLTLPDVAVSSWPKGLESPLSPSETHLLEDLPIEDDDVHKQGYSNLRSSDHHSDDPDSLHDSGIPSSPPPWFWPRKRVAQFDERSSSDPPERRETAMKEKRKCELKTDRSTSLQMYGSNMWSSKFCNENTLQNDLTRNPSLENCSAVFNSSHPGLYRVQSCPGMLTAVTTTLLSEKDFIERGKFLDGTLPRVHKNKKSNIGMSQLYCHKYSFTSGDLVDIKRVAVSHESCPDMQGGTETTNMQPSSDFRRNVRMIQVS